MCLQLFYSLQKSLHTMAFSTSFFNKAGSREEELAPRPVSVKGRICSGKKPVTVSFTFATLLEPLIY